MRKDRPLPSALRPLREPELDLRELEARLESQLLSPPLSLDDDICLYFLCTTRCSATKCPVFCPCDVDLHFGG